MTGVDVDVLGSDDPFGYSDRRLCSVSGLLTHTGFTRPPNVLPSVSITSPANGATISAATATITVSASDSDPGGSIASVAALVDGVVVATDNAAPYLLTVSLENGTRTIAARATDNDGGQATSPAIVVTVDAPPPGADTLITVMTVTERGVGNKTGELIEFGLPLSPTALPSDRYIKVYDDNGSGGQGSALTAVQWDVESRDGLAAAAEKRMGKVTAILPAIASGATRKLRVMASESPLPTGTEITIADVLALPGAANGLLEVVITDAFSGATHSLKAGDILQSGTTTFSKTALWRCSQNWRAGPFCTEWRLRAAPRDGSSNPHASGDGVHIEFHLAAHKALAGPVTVDNPITLLTCTAAFYNEDTERGQAVVQDWLYGVEIRRATSLADPTMVTTDQVHPVYGKQRAAWPNIALPGGSIALSSAAVGENRTITLTGGVWPAQIKGLCIAPRTGDGRATIVSRTSNTQAVAIVRQAFGATSYADGDWVTAGIEHWYGSPWAAHFAIGNVPTTVPAWGDLNSAVSPNSRGVMEYLASTKLALNYQMAFPASDWDVTKLDNLMDDGVQRPFHCDIQKTNPTNWGDVKIALPDGGSSNAIGHFTRWDVQGLVRYSDAGRKKIFGNARNWLTYYNAPVRLSGTPLAGSIAALTPRTDQAVGRYEDYKTNSAHDGRMIYWPSYTSNVYNGDGSHNGMCAYVPYLLTGDYFWAHAVWKQAEPYASISISNYYKGINANRTPLGDPSGVNHQGLVFGGSNPRTNAIGIREALCAAIITPDAPKDQLYNAKAWHRDRIEAMWAAGKLYGPTDHLNKFLPNPDSVWMNTTVLSDEWGGHQAWFDNMWQLGFMLRNVLAAKRMGLSNADRDDIVDFFKRNYIERRVAAGVVPDYYTALYQCMLAYTRYAGENPDNIDAATTYRRGALGSPAAHNYFEQGHARRAAGTVTVSDATVGTGRVITFSNNYFGAGSWYHTGFIGHRSSGSGPQNGLSQITSVIAPNQVEVEHLVAWSTTTPTAANVSIPGPHPSDYTGEKATVAGDYPQIWDVVCTLLMDEGIAGASAARDYMRARPGFSQANDFWHIAES